MVNSKIWSRISTNRGFGLAEAMISVAVVGLISTIVVSQQKLAAKSAYNVASDTEINNLTNKVVAEIGDQQTCTSNFGGFAFAKSYTKLTNKAGGDLIVTTQKYGNSIGEITVNSIKTELKAAGNFNEMVLVIAYRKKEGGSIFSSRDVVREVVLNTVSLDGGTTVNSCYANFDLVIKTAIQLSCQGNTAYYDANQNSPYGACVHISEVKTCPAGQFLKTVFTGANKDIQYTCATIDTACSNPKEFVTAFNADGTVTCGPIVKACPAGSVITTNAVGAQVCTVLDCTGISPISAFNGFTAGGAVICSQITSLKNCGTDNFATQVNTDGSITCSVQAVSGSSCPVGQRIQGITSTGTINCVPFMNLPMDCGAGNAITGINSSGNPTCAPINRPLSCYGAGGGHTYNSCTGAGGSITNAYSSGSMCTFNGASCPGGWSRCQSWGTQTTSSCSDTGTGGCGATIRYATPFGGNGAFQNNGQNSVTCYNWTATWPYGGSYTCSASANSSATSNQTSVGCY